MSAESVALIPECAEVRRPLVVGLDKERWSAFCTDDEPPELVFYCPECAEWEFDPDLREASEMPRLRHALRFRQT